MKPVAGLRVPSMISTSGMLAVELAASVHSTLSPRANGSEGIASAQHFRRSCSCSSDETLP